MARQRRILLVSAFAWLMGCSGGPTSGEAGKRIADDPANQAKAKTESRPVKEAPPPPPPPPPDR